MKESCAKVWAGLRVNIQAGSTKNSWKITPHPTLRAKGAGKECCLELCLGRGNNWQRLRPHGKKSSHCLLGLSKEINILTLFLSLSYSPGASHWPSLIRTQGQDGKLIQWINLPGVQCWKKKWSKSGMRISSMLFTKPWLLLFFFNTSLSSSTFHIPSYLISCRLKRKYGAVCMSAWMCTHLCVHTDTRTQPCKEGWGIRVDVNTAAFYKAGLGNRSH